MARIARSKVFNSQELGVYHVYNRTVRRRYLHGVDELTGQDYSYRRTWFRERMQSLAEHLCVDVLAYAIMSNHWHAVLRNRPDLVAKLSDREVVIRWLSLTSRRRCRSKKGGKIAEAEIAAIVNDPDRVKDLRHRLSHISWFVRLMCQTIARRCNLEDEVTGHFFEARYKLNRLDDEATVLAAMAYVDLNPLRAQLAASLDDFAEVSIYDRLRSLDDESIDLASWLAPLELVREVDGRPVEVVHDRTPQRISEQEQSLRDRLGCLPMKLDAYKKLLWRLAVESRPELQASTGLTAETFRGSIPLGNETVNIDELVERHRQYQCRCSATLGANARRVIQRRGQAQRPMGSSSSPPGPASAVV